MPKLYAGCYKFALNIGKKTNFIIYKLVVLLQLAVILYTRVYLWFPSAISLRAHIKDQNDTLFLYGATFMMCIFSLFNLILVADGFKAAIKCVPKPFPKNEAEKEKTTKLFKEASVIDMGGFGAPVTVAKMLLRKRKFKAAVDAVIAAKRMESSMSSNGAEKKAQ